MKKHVQQVLLPLLFSFCCVFSGFLSVDVFAINSLEGTFVNSWMLTTVDDGTRSMELVVQSSNAVLGTFSADYNDIYKYSNPSFSNVTYLTFGQSSQNFDFEYLPSIYDYYVALRVHSNDVSAVSDFSYFPNNAYVRFYGLTSGSDFVNAYLQDISVEKYTDRDQIGFQLVGRIPSLESGLINMIRLISPSGTVPANLEVEGLIIAFEKSSQSQTQSIVAAINNQTGILGGKLDGIDSSVDQAADDIQQSIEDQFSGDPEEEFSVDDVITQHNEKMGVLSFGSDVMLQFLDMFQSANVGTAQLTLPGFNITVEDVEYSVWPDYSFNFEHLNEWVPGLMSVIRMMLPAFVWLMVLRYCVNVFEKNFLSNGG